jgi:uncharacterized tellurite resistance protein B-like protein
MATLGPARRHPALEIAEPERLDYLIVVASMAYADRVIDDAELLRVGQMCEHLGLSQSSTERVLAAIGAPDRVAVASILDRLRASALRFALLADAIDVAWADDRLDRQESAEIAAVAERLGVTSGQLAMIQRYVGDRRQVATVDGTRELAAGLSATGIPVAALAVASAVDAPLAPGVGIAAALGANRDRSVRWLHARATARAD